MPLALVNVSVKFHHLTTVLFYFEDALASSASVFKINLGYFDPQFVLDNENK